MPTESVWGGPSTSDPPREIILFEGDEERRRRVLDALGRAGWSVRPVETAEEAFAAVSATTAIVIAGAEMMTRERGSELWARLKADPRTSHVLAVLWQHEAQPPHQCVAALESGVDAIFKSPMDDLELTAAIRALMRLQKAEQQVRRSAERSRFLAELGAALAGPVRGVNEILERVLEASVPAFADCAAVEVGYEGGERRTVVVRHVDKAVEARVRELLARVPPSRNPYWASVFASREATVIPDFSAFFREVEEEEEARRTIEAMKLQSVALAPFAGSRIQGSLIFGLCKSDRRYDQSDIPLVTGVAHRATLAIENALLLGALRDQLEFHQRLLGIVGHDLRQPLQAIVIGLQALSKHKASARATRLAANALSSARRATRLVEDLLDLTRVQLGRSLPVSFQPAELGELVSRCVEEARQAHPKRVLELDAPEELNGVWDPERVKQAVTNLISNAMTHGDPAVPVRVRVVRREGGGVEVSVWNRGPVIPPERIPDLFHPYSSARGESGHLGLGLFIVDQVARAHGGGVEVTSSAEDGTVFALRLPHLSGEAHPDAW